MLARVQTAQIVGLKADVIDVEVDVSKGLHSFSIVGLPDKAVEEARDRISAAIKNSGFRPPQRGNRKTIVSLAPADLKKEGASFDLAIALGHLLATGEIKFATDGRAFLGELALNGELRPIRGTLMIVKKLKESGFAEVYVPRANAREAALIRGIKIFGAGSLRELTHHLSPARTIGEQKNLQIVVKKLQPFPPTQIVSKPHFALIDFADVKDQPAAKRGLEIAAAGGHNAAMAGPPGTGKTMLAKALVGILPPLDFDSVLEVTGIHSAAGTLAGDLITEPVFRSPHHTASYVALVGGGASPKPGEITLAHRGVLFLDEFPEFDKRVIESLRQPLEDRAINVSRQRGSITFPAGFLLVAAMNYCPCGQTGLKDKECLCSPGALDRYRRKISGPVMDRIDLWLEVPQIDPSRLSEDGVGESSAEVRARVMAARAIQQRRFAGTNFKTNSEMGVKELKKFAPLTAGSTKILNDAARRLDLSARAYHRVIKIARTIADLSNAPQIADHHLMEALQYRPRNLSSR